MGSRLGSRTEGRGWRMAALGLFGALSVLGLSVLAAKGRKEAASEDREVELGADAKNPAVFLRPSILQPGGTYELYLDVADGEFSKETAVRSREPAVSILSAAQRGRQGLTLTVAVAANAPEGLVPLEVRTPVLGAEARAVEAVIEIARAANLGPRIAFENLPRGDRLVAEGSFAHIEVAIEGNGPFYVEFGLRSRSYWAGMAWAAAERTHAADAGLTVEGPERGSFALPLPEEVNVVDIVAIDRNGWETWCSLVVESLAPCSLEKEREVGLLERLFARKDAWAADNPTFSFYNASTSGLGGAPYLDFDGTRPLTFTESTWQGVECESCCGPCGCSTLDVAGVGGGGGGYETRPDGYVAPTAMMRERGEVLTHSGEYTYSVVDLSLPVPGLEFAIRRTYRSQISYHGILGRNWDMNVYARYLRYGTATGTSAGYTGDLYFYRGSGRRDGYAQASPGSGTFVAPAGFYDKFFAFSTGLQMELRKKDGKRWVFSESQIGPNTVFGKLKYIYGAVSNNYLYFTYDFNGRLTHITSSAQVGLTFTYDGNGYLTRIHQDQYVVDIGGETNYCNHEVRYSRDSTYGVLEKVEYGYTTYYAHDGSGGLTTFSASNGARKKIVYEYVTDPDSGDRRYNLTRVYDGRANDLESPYALVEVAYDGSDRVESFVSDPDGAGPAWTYAKREFSYGTVGSRKQTTVRTWGADSSSSQGLGYLRQLVQLYDATSGGMLERSVYANTGSLESPTWTEIGTWAYERDCSCNRETKITDPLGRVEHRAYDAYGNLVLTRVEGPTAGDYRDDIITLYSYDPPYYVNGSYYGALRQVASPNAVAPYVTQDAIPAISSIPASGKTRYTYSGANLTKVEPPEIVYAAEFSEGSAQPSVNYSYAGNSFGQPTEITAKLGSTVLKKTKIVYSMEGAKRNLVQKIIVDPDDGTPPAELALTHEYAYNARRDLISYKDPRGNTTEYVWSEDRLLEAIRPPALAVPEMPNEVRADREVRFKYDANNNRIWSDVGGNTYASGAYDRFETYFEYDVLNQLVSERRDVDSSTSLETAYEYDGEGHAYKVVGPGGETIRTSREYLEEENAEGTAVYMLLVRRLMEVSVPPSGTEWRLVSEAAYERGERLFRESRFFAGAEGSARSGFDFSSTWYKYDAAGRREAVVSSPTARSPAESSGVLVWDYSEGDVFYASFEGRDKDGNVLTLERGEETSPGSVASLFSKASYALLYGARYDYDALDREIRERLYPAYADFSGDTNAVKTLRQPTFDGQVKRTRRVLDSGSADTYYSYDAASRLKQVSYPDATSVSYVYDSAGNVTEVWSGEYDEVNMHNLPGTAARGHPKTVTSQ